MTLLNHHFPALLQIRRFLRTLGGGGRRFPWEWVNWHMALVQSSLLSRKGKYQTIANNLPTSGVLICQTDKKKPRISRILAQVARWLAENGHFVQTLPYSLI